MKMKITAIAFVAMFSCAANAQIPVTDGASIAQNMANQIQTMAQWAQQIAEMQQQYSELQRHWDKMDQMEKLVTGARYLGVPNTPGISGQIPGTIDGIYSGSYGSTQSIMSAERIGGTSAATQDALNERYLKTAAAEKAAALNTYQGAQERLNNINTLIAKIDTAQDPKAIQDLQARIAAEQALVQNETTKLQMVSQLAAAEQKLVDDQRRQMNRDILNPDNTGMPEIK
ncbi:P-type DNA transfer protein VirB5 [Pseudomonas stutzeri]|nr:P-type DNA transfer protein VirB5 [Stutzerimonas stutzeri]